MLPFAKKTIYCYFQISRKYQHYQQLNLVILPYPSRYYDVKVILPAAAGYQSETSWQTNFASFSYDSSKNKPALCKIMGI